MKTTRACTFRSAVMLIAALACCAPLIRAQEWSFAVSGDSRNCGDFVMPAIAASVQAEGDAFYWHLGDFRWIVMPDQDMQAMQPAGSHLSRGEYLRTAWDDFTIHQVAAFGSEPVFVGRGNHETVPPMSRDGYVAHFYSLLSRPEIQQQRAKDGSWAAPIGPWYHWTHNGVDFITLDNASKSEFSPEQLKWLRAVLDSDLAPGSQIHSIVAGMHEALPHSTGSNHAMDDWEDGVRTGEQVFSWFAGAQAAGKHVYLLASHSHYYSPHVYATPFWKQRYGSEIPGWIIGSAGAHRYKLPADAAPGAKTHIYGYLRATVHRDGTIDFALHELTEQELVAHRWPIAPLDAIHECFVHNAD